MTLTDAGPLIAIIDKNEEDHKACVLALSHIALPLVTTWLAFTEAMYMLYEAKGWHGQELLWRLVLRGQLELVAPSANMHARMAELMARYYDVPMDAADASLVVIAEDRKIRRIFTLDSDFQIYRLKDKKPLEVIP